MIETIYLQNIVFGIQLAHCIHLEGMFLKRGKFKKFIGMDAAKLRLSMINRMT